MIALLWTFLGAVTCVALSTLGGAGLAVWAKRRFPDHDDGGAS